MRGSDTSPLTARQTEVLTMVSDGLCNKAIANRLGVSLGTVKCHVTEIFGKLGVHTRTQAALSKDVPSSYGLRCRRSQTVALKG